MKSKLKNKKLEYSGKLICKLEQDGVLTEEQKKDVTAILVPNDETKEIFQVYLQKRNCRLKKHEKEFLTKTLEKRKQHLACGNQEQNFYNSTKWIDIQITDENKKKDVKRLWLEFLDLQQQDRLHKSWLFQMCNSFWPEEKPEKGIQKILYTLSNTPESYDIVKQLYSLSFMQERSCTANKIVLETFWKEKQYHNLWKMSDENRFFPAAVFGLLEIIEHQSVPEPWQILHTVLSLKKKNYRDFKVTVFVNNCVLIATKDGWKYNAEQTLLPLEQTPILINCGKEVNISMSVPSLWVNRKLQMYLKMKTGTWKKFYTHPDSLIPHTLQNATLPLPSNASVYATIKAKQYVKEIAFCILCSLDTHFNVSSDYQPIVPPLINKHGAIAFAKFLEQLLLPNKKPCQPFQALQSSLVSPSLSLAVIITKLLIANLEFSPTKHVSTWQTKQPTKSNLQQFAWDTEKKTGIFMTQENNIYQAVLKGTQSVVIVVTNNDQGKLLESILNSLPIFHFLGGCNLFVDKQLNSKPVQISTLENLQHLSRKKEPPAAFFFWGLSSYLGTIPSAKDTLKSKTYAYLWLQCSFFSEIPKIMIPETRYVQFQTTKTLALRQSLRSSNVTRVLLQFLIDYEPNKQNKIRQNVACRGASFPSKAFVLHPAEKCVPSNQKLQFCELRFMLNPAFVDVNKLEKLNDTNCSKAGVHLVFFKEMNFIGKTQFQRLQQEMKCTRDVRALINCCFGDPFSVLFHKNTRIAQVATKIALQYSPEEKAPMPIMKGQITKDFLKGIILKHKWMLNSNLRISIGSALFVALSHGSVVVMTSCKDSENTFPALVSLFLEIIAKSLLDRNLITYFDPVELQNSIYSQQQKWQHQPNILLQDRRKKHIFGYYLQQTDLQKKTIHLQNFQFDLWCTDQSQIPDNERIVLFSKQAEISFQKEKVQGVLRTLQNWKPSPTEILQLQKFFAGGPSTYLPKNILDLSQVLVIKLDLSDFVSLLNLSWLLNIQPLFQLLCIAFPLPLFLDTPNDQNCPYFSNAGGSNDKEIRLQIDDYTIYNTKKLNNYRYLGKELAKIGLLKAEDYEPSGSDRNVFWKETGLSLGQSKNVEVLFNIRKKKGEPVKSYSYLKENTLPLIDLLLHCKGWGADNHNSLVVWICNPHLLPIGTRLRSPAVCSVKVLGNFFTGDVPLMRLDGLVYTIVTELFVKKPFPMHENHEWLVQQAERNTVSEEELAKHVVQAPVPDIAWGKSNFPNPQLKSFVEFAGIAIEKELSSACKNPVRKFSAEPPPAKKRKISKPVLKKEDNANCSSIARLGLGLL